MTDTTPTPVQDVLTKEQVAELLQVPVRTIEDWRARGRFSSDLERRALQGVKLGGHVRYSRKLILAVINGEQEAAA